MGLFLDDSVNEIYMDQKNKGYGTREHDIALQKLGPCSFHRYTYAPVAACGITSN